VNVLLYHIAGLALERLIALSAIYQHIAGDDARRGATSKNIEKRGLACAGHALPFN
jgi:hypothetical protein